MSSQQEISENIKDTSNHPWNQHYPEDYEVVRNLYDIFTFGNELYMYTSYDTCIMCERLKILLTHSLMSSQINTV